MNGVACKRVERPNPGFALRLQVLPGGGEKTNRLNDSDLPCSKRNRVPLESCPHTDSFERIKTQFLLEILDY